MLIYIVSSVMLLSLVCWVAERLYRVTLPKSQFGFKGKLVYLDDNKHPLLLNHRYKVQSKPDFIFRTGLRKYTLVEYKSRKKGCYDSDRKQMYASTLSARSSGFNVTRGVLATKEHLYNVDLSHSNRRLFRMIRDEVNAIALARRGKIAPPHITNRCRKTQCRMLSHCESSK